MSKKAIVCVDDEPMVLTSLRDQLESAFGEQYHYEFAESATEAFEVIDELHERSFEILIIVSDWLMPGMKGDELLCWIHRKSPETLTILLTGHANMEAVSHAINAANLHRYVSKPWDQDNLLLIVNEAIQEFIHAKLIQEHQRELETLNASLEQKVAERTRKLEANNRLLQAANRELSDFAYIVSHDLKAPLRGMMQLVNWLIEDYASLFDEKARQYADLLLKQAKRMDNLINGILGYSRVGYAAVKDEPLDLSALLPEVLDRLAMPPHIRVTLPPELPVIVGDKTRISQVFQNVIGNAVKYHDKPTGCVEIGCCDDGDQWKFSVADNGPGIDPQYHAKIFQMFQTLRPSDDHESTGIGLTIVKKIVEDVYGGKIWVESAVGQGSIFWFTFPKQGGRHEP